MMLFNRNKIDIYNGSTNEIAVLYLTWTRDIVFNATSGIPMEKNVPLYVLK